MHVVGWRSLRSLAVAALLFGSISLTACGPPSCSTSAADITIVGPLIARKGSAATFVVESRQRSSTSTSRQSTAPELVVGQRVEVQYYSGARFLRVGTRYQVALFWRSGQFTSAVHSASDPCSWGTTYANGKAIDTSWWKHSSLRTLTYVAASLPLIVVIVGIGTAAATRRRRKRAHTEAP